MKPTEAERARIRRWVRHMLPGAPTANIEMETHALCLIFECMLRDRIGEPGILARRHADKIAIIRKIRPWEKRWTSGRYHRVISPGPG